MSYGIICEYNPFHNGHIYHLNKVKELAKDDVIILVLSGNYTQRGDISIIEKFDKAEIALEYGVDLVVELPFEFSTQSSDIFARGAVQILNHLGVEYIVFGSESNDIVKLNNLANIQNSIEYNYEVKKLMKEGESYPKATASALKHLHGEDVSTPNDILALSYIREIKNINSNITPLSIKRTNDFNSNKIQGNIISANLIRNNLDKIEIAKYVPKNAIKNYYKVNYFNYLKYKILSDNDLSIYQTVDEGIENKLKKGIIDSFTLEDLILSIKSKRYTYNKINRMFIHILTSFTKEEATKRKEIKYIRVLGFNKKGKDYLNKIKKNISVPIYTNFNKELELELKVTKIYSQIVNDPSLIDKEIKNIIIKK
jgi:predicted nucleotidyltransferase